MLKCHFTTLNPPTTAKAVSSSLPFPGARETLKTNRRSETNVIHFNNRLFTAAVDYLNALHLEELKEECIPLKRAYADVAQNLPRRKTKAMSKSPSWSPMKNRTTRKRPCRLWAKKCKGCFREGVKAERYKPFLCAKTRIYHPLRITSTKSCTCPLYRTKRSAWMPRLPFAC